MRCRVKRECLPLLPSTDNQTVPLIRFGRARKEKKRKNHHVPHQHFFQLLSTACPVEYFNPLLYIHLQDSRVSTCPGQHGSHLDTRIELLGIPAVLPEVLLPEHLFSQHSFVSGPVEERHGGECPN